MSYQCELDNHEIKDEYEEVCEKWEYWHWRPPDWNPHLGRKNCRSCKFAEWKGK